MGIKQVHRRIGQARHNFHRAGGTRYTIKAAPKLYEPIITVQTLAHRKNCHIPLNFSNIALDYLAASGMFVHFFCCYFQPLLATAEKLTAAFWKLHLKGGGSN